MNKCTYRSECSLYEHENGRCQFFYMLCSQYKLFEKDVKPEPTRIELPFYMHPRVISAEEAESKMWEEKDLVTRLREEGGL